ncbi:MAG: response regulator [Actinobacteria bacterium]|jgi:OmpR family response regulator RpaB|nr:MAG: response regulator [Actinomycetota bacterium]
MARVLIVEDSELLLRIMLDAIEAGGHEVITAGDGEVALKRFIEEKPDLLITDCLIPKMDGFKLVKNIREFEAPQRTPVVMTSAIYRKASYRDVAMEAGADLYLTKPTNPEEYREFAQRVDRLLETVTGGVVSQEVPRS